MKTKIQKLIRMTVLGMTLQIQSLPAWAGMVSNTEVTILLDKDGYNAIGAYGTLTGARSSADKVQYLECYDSLANHISCKARDKTGRYTAFCFSTDPKFIAAVNGMTDSSYIHFRVAPGSSQCSQLVVSNGSSNLR